MNLSLPPIIKDNWLLQEWLRILRDYVIGSEIPGRSQPGVIVNGGMAIDRLNDGAAQTITAAAALAYTVDQWYAYCTGANVTGQRVAGSGSTQYRYQFTGAASVTAIGFAQRMERDYTYHLAGQTATFSVDLSNSLLTTVTWTAYYANTANTFGSLASPTRTQIATGTFTVSSTLGRYTAQIAIPSAATTGIEIVFSVGAQTSGTWVIGDVALKPGALTDAVYEKRADDLEMCYRYLPGLRSDSTTSMICKGAISSTSAGVLVLPFAFQARTRPTGIISSAASTFSLVVSGVSGTAGTAIAVGSTTSKTAGVFVLTGTGTPYTIGHAAYASFSSASGYLFFTGAQL